MKQNVQISANAYKKSPTVAWWSTVQMQERSNSNNFQFKNISKAKKFLLKTNKLYCYVEMDSEQGLAKWNTVQ